METPSPQRPAGMVALPPLLLALLCLTGCSGSIDGAALAARLAAPEGRPVVVDVRTRGEYTGGHLPGAVHIPVLSLPFRLAAVPVREGSAPVVVYCAHGPRAGLAGFFLRLAGFSGVLHLRGDIRSWRDEGRPLATGPAPGVFGG